MIRRNTFCPSELPSTAQSFDEYFSIDRPHPSQEAFPWTGKRTRACSLGGTDGKPNFEERVAMASGLDEFVEAHVATQMQIKAQAQAQAQSQTAATGLAEAQVDGPAERKKARKAKKKKAGRKGMSEGGENEEQEKNGEEIGTGGEHVQEKNSVVKEHPAVREVIVVHGDGQGKRKKEEEEQVSVEMIEDVGEDRDAGLQGQEEEAVEDPQAELVERDSDNAACRVHGRLLCQFHAACCVHRPMQDGCGCPPRHSCCCMHHAGDCCTCRRDDPVVTPDADDNTSKTLSAATPATPDSSPAAADAAPATVSTTASASASTPPNPAGVKLMVTPASPSPLKCAEPVIMGGAEDAGTMAAQASLELSKALLEMLDIGHVSDYRLTLRSITDQFLPIHLTAHRCILARSPLVSTLVHDPYYRHELVVLACENFTMVKPWEQVVHYLYGRPMLTSETLKPATLDGLGYDPFPERGCEPEYPFSVPAAMMDMALGYAVCGAFFYLPAIVDTGFGLALDLISWETVEHLLYFGLCTHKFAVILPTRPWSNPHPQHDPRQDVRHAHAAEVPETDTPGQEKHKAPEASTNTVGATATPIPFFPLGVDVGVDLSQLPPYPIYLLEGDWSHRIITAALNFLLDHVKPGFEIYRAAKSDIVPNRVPGYLRAPPGVPKSPAETQENECTLNTPPAPETPSFAVANNPRLAEVKFGFFSNSEGESNGDEQPKPKSKSQKKKEKEREKKKLQEEQAHVAEEAKRSTAVPGPEITVTSAVLLSVGYHHLQLTFRMLSERNVLTPSIAKSIILEREARRRAALKRYTEMVIANRSGASENASPNADATTSATDVSADPSADSKKKAKAKKGKEKDNVDVIISVAQMPDEVRELCYREFFGTKSKAGPGAAGQNELEVEIFLQREWLGIEH
ncbi:hypothetical protein BJY00DRAFT_311805 [Aspergillus carlsbadensis]|nr:hypothetical protein BJY00DRAFT_311805 [Aspergillus carlsbadensis]